MLGLWVIAFVAIVPEFVTRSKGLNLLQMVAATSATRFFPYLIIQVYTYIDKKSTLKNQNSNMHKTNHKNYTTYIKWLCMTFSEK